MPTYEAYKDSGVQKIGVVPVDWYVKKIKFLTKLNTDSLPENTQPTLQFEYVDIGSVSFENGIEKTEVVTFKNSPSRARRRAKSGDVVVSSVRTYLKAISYVDSKSEHFVYSTGFAVISPGSTLYPPYLGYSVKSSSFTEQVDLVAKGMSYPAINSTELGNLYLLEPPIDQQTLIANFLDKKTAQIDEAIAIKEQQIALLKERKRIIIQKAVTQGLDPDVPMKDSDVDWIGEIPVHWDVVALAYALNAVGDVDHYMPETIDTGVPYFMTGDLEDLVSQMSFDDCKKVSYRDYNKLTKKIKTEVGDVILARYATIGTVTYVDINEEFLVSYSCVTIKTDKKFLNGMYLFYFLKSDTFAQAVSKVVNTNTQGNVGIGDLKKIKIALPPLREQERLVRSIAKRLSEIDVVIEAQVNQISKLKEYKTTLINSAVTGKIRITPEMVA